MVAVLFCLALQGSSTELTSLSTLIDKSLKASRWSTEGSWYDPRPTRRSALFDYGDRLEAHTTIEIHKGPGFYESRDPRKYIALLSRTELSRKGKDWSIWILDFTDSERKAGSDQPAHANLSLIFHHGLIGGTIRVKSPRSRGYFAQDRTVAKHTLAVIAAKLESKFRGS